MRHLFLVLALLCVGCGGERTPNTPTSPTPFVPACQANSTADVSLRNTSTTGLTFDVLIDNIRRGTMTPTQILGPFTVAAGVAHTIESRVTNTTVIACSSSSAFAQCSTQTLTCSR